MVTFREELVKAAKSELAIVAGKKETDPVTHPKLSEYWIHGTGLRNFTKAGKTITAQSQANNFIKARTAWSAAFISFVVRRALAASGDPAEFEFSSNHSVYAGAAIRNRIAKLGKPAFYAFPPTGLGAVKPEVGDIIGVPRVTTIDDFAAAMKAATKLPKPETYASHFDIVVEISGNKLKKIGGNVSDSVTQKTETLTSAGVLPVKPFKFDAAGHLIQAPYICVIKHVV